MKRYDLYSHDDQSNFRYANYPIHEEGGQWVDAHIAQELYDELVRVREVIASLPIESLGAGHAIDCHPWPIRDEVVDGISRVIHKADKD